MGRINKLNKHSNENWVNQHRKSQGKFLEEQDIEALLFSKNGNNIQEKNTPNIDDLPNIPAILDYALNLPKKNSIEPINGAIPHTPIGQALLPILTALTALSGVSPTTVPFQKAISTGTPNGLLSKVTSATGKMPVLFDTTPATTSTSKNHAQSKKLTKHSDDSSLIREKDGLIRHSADGNIILSNNGKKLTFSHHLDIKILKEQLENSNITELCLWEVPTVRQKAQEIGKILKGSNVKILSILHGSIEGIDFGILRDTKVTTLNLAYNGIGNKGAIGLESLKGTNVEELNLSHNGIDNKGARGLIESLEGTKVKELNLSDNIIGKTGKGAKGLFTLLKNTEVEVVDLSHNNMRDDQVKKIIPELKNTKIIVLGLKDPGIKRNTLKEVSNVLEQNRQVNQVNKESTSTIKSSPTEGEFSTEENPTSSKKREKRAVTTDDKTLKQDTTVLTTVSTTTKEASTTLTSTTKETPTTLTTITPTTKSTDSATVLSNLQETTTLKEELTEKSEPIAAGVVVDSTTKQTTNSNSPAASNIREGSGLITADVVVDSTTKQTTNSNSPVASNIKEASGLITADVVADSTTEKPPTTTTETPTTTESTAASTSATTEQETTVPTTLKSSTTTTESTTSSTEGLTTTEQETIVPTTLKSSTSTTESTTSSTEGLTTTEQETTVPTTVTESTAASTSTTAKQETIAPIAVKFGVLTTDVSTTTTKSTAFSAGNPTTLKEELTTPKKNLTEKPEPIAADVVVDSITEKHTPKESNPNNLAGDIKDGLGLIAASGVAVVAAVAAVVATIKKFCGGVSRLGHNALALADLAESDDRLDNNEETSSLTGVIVDDNADI